jgi:tRNA-binding EMAP/Myf-like protein
LTYRHLLSAVSGLVIIEQAIQETCFQDDIRKELVILQKIPGSAMKGQGSEGMLAAVKSQSAQSRSTASESAF